jgi:hypothetical protein
MTQIKIINIRSIGNLFHYAHFLCDCLFPEIISNIFDYNEVIREKNLDQTIGNFSKIYTDVMRIKNTELESKEFKKLNLNTIYCNTIKEDYCNKMCFNKFRKFIFERYNINNLEYNNDYPEIILIKRGKRINLIDDKYLSTINDNFENGKERREINDIINVEKFLQNKYKNKFKSLEFEKLPFEEQVKYFNNAKLIICAHGAVMSNMFFCKEKTKIIEVTCGTLYPFFDKISNILNLHHIKCHENKFNNIIKIINLLYVN